MTLLSAYAKHKAQAEFLAAGAIWCPPAATERHRELRAEAKYHQLIALCVLKRMARNERRKS